MQEVLQAADLESSQYFKTNNNVTKIFTRKNLNDIFVIKKDGTKEKFNLDKVVTAVKKSSERILITLSENDLKTICNYVSNSLVPNPNVIVIKG